MIRQYLLLVFSLMTIGLSAQSYWTTKEVTTFRTNVPEEMKFIMPSEYQSYELAIDEIMAKLATAPSIYDKNKSAKKITIQLPMDNGRMETFEMYYSPVMQDGLATKYPNIRSYKGVSTKQRNKNVRLSVGPYGLHAAIHSPEKVVYIDPYSKLNREEYLVYDVKNHVTQLNIDVPTCGVDHGHGHNQVITPAFKQRNVATIDMKEYRIAIACTGEWGRIRGTVEKAIADMVTGVNRMNQIFENELALRVRLIDNNDQLIFLDNQTDPYNSVNSGSSMLSVNTAVINNAVGVGSYDVGHVYSTSCDVGGIAALRSWCNNNKGAGVTCHYSNNLDYMASNVTSHELGHMMSARHTFNNCGGITDTNVDSANGYEPGSGTTIMSYAGSCGSNNVQGSGDDNYHVASLGQIYNHTREGGIAFDCAVKVPTDNMEPIIDLPYTGVQYIPEETYFFLEGTATDANDDNLTYSWEQFNSGSVNPLGNPVGNSPRFRVFPPSPVSTRYFPSKDNVLNFIFDKSEVLPEGNLDMDFMFVVRDNNFEAGTAVWERMNVSSVATPEKFGITSPNTNNMTFDVGEEVKVEWNVANTDISPINATTVDILLNTSNSSDFDIHNMTVLAENVPNNGEAFVYIPNESTNRGRFVIRAHDKIFFSVSRFNFIINESQEPTLLMNNNPSAISSCLPETQTVTISTEGINLNEGIIQLSVENLPVGATATFANKNIPVGESTTIDFSFDETADSGALTFDLVGTIDTTVMLRKKIALYTINNDHTALQEISPENGVFSNPAPVFEWTPSANAETYNIEVATSPTFGESIVFSSYGQTDTDFASPEILNTGTIYYWKVTPINVCGEGPSIINSFGTEALACSEFGTNEDDLPANLSQSGTPTIEVPISVQGGGIVDVNITEFYGEHSNNKDMVATLISPAGTSAVLFSRICEQTDFNCTFDDQSNTPARCPLNAAGKAYRPKESFSIFNGENAQGTWIVKIEDQAPGNGGALKGVKIEVCASQSISSPYIINNNTLEIGWGSNKIISQEELKVADDDNNKWETKYTIVRLPNRGTLTFDGNILKVGDQFNQDEVNRNKIRYQADDENYQDSFDFTVTDGTGGFLGITKFNINVDEMTEVVDFEDAGDIAIYPVPTRNQLTIDMTQAKEGFQLLTVFDINGKKMIQQQINHNKMVIDVSKLTSGIYIITLQNADKTIPKKIIIE